MRYTTARFGETARLLGEFAQGRPASVASGVFMSLFLLDTGAAVPLTTSGCTEISGSRVGGFASYAWPTSFITTQPTTETEYLYVMQDAITARAQKGKFILGGHPDESGIQRFQSGVSIDTVSGVAGTTYPLGTPESPVSNLADALSIRSIFSLPRTLRVRGQLTLSGNLTRFNFEGVDPLNDRVTAASGCILNGAGFERLTIAGDFSATTSGVVGSELTIGVTGQTISGLRGLFLTALVRGTIRPSTSFIGLNISTDETFGAVLEMAGAPSPTRVAIGSVIGQWTIQGGAGAGHQVGIGGNGVRLTLGGSTTGGVYIFSGVGELDDQSTSVNSTTDTLVKGTLLDVAVSTRATPGDHMNIVLSGVSGIADRVWDEILSEHAIAGSTGAALALASGQAPTVGAIADAVWDEAIAGHLGVGSTGSGLQTARQHLINRRRIDTTTDPWQEVIYADDGTTEIQRADLFDSLGNPINSGNNPGGIMIAERTP